MIAAAFFGLLRVGEITKDQHVIKLGNVHIGVNKNKILFVLKTSKTHWTDCKPKIVKILGKPIQSLNQKLDKQMCPLTILKCYLRCRPIADNTEEQFFVFADNSPVKAMQLGKALKRMLTNAGLDAGYSQLKNRKSIRFT